MIFSNKSDLSKEEIKALIDKELSKNPEDVDTDYIDLCFELMSICEKSENNVVSIKPGYVKKPIHYAKKSLFSTQKIEVATGYLTF